MSIASVNKPNFFILGAGKSGTTSLYWYLKQHPEIFLTKIKEPTFFNEGFQSVKNPIDYFKQYDSVINESIIGESSHAYLSNPSTARVLRALFPDSKFLVILRNPADRAYSLYHHMRRNGYEYINTFEKALDAEDVRCSSSKFLKKCPQYLYNFLYFRSGLYGKQLKNYFSFFPKEQFHIIQFEQFVTDPNKSFKRIFEFLGVDPDFTTDNELRNPGGVTSRFPKVRHFVGMHVKKPRAVRHILYGMLSKIDSIDTPLMQQETKEELIGRYRPDLQILHEMTGISFLE